MKLYRGVCCLIPSGRIFHVLGPKKEVVSLPWYTETGGAEINHSESKKLVMFLLTNWNLTVI